MKNRFNYLSLVQGLIIALFSMIIMGCQDRAKKVHVDVVFNDNTIVRKGHYGDNWCQTWATDGNIYTMLDDGNGWWGEQIKSGEVKQIPGTGGLWQIACSIRRNNINRATCRSYGYTRTTFWINPKWISDDGKTMVLIWSDASDRHSTNYKWNQMEIELIVE